MSTLIPQSVLFGGPAFDHPVVSPDGSRLAYFAPHDGVLTVWVRPVDGGEARPVPLEGSRPVSLGLVWWTGDSEHLLFLRDQDGNELFHVFAYSLASGEVRDLTPFDSIQAMPVRTSAARPHEVAVKLNLDDPKWHDVHVIDVRTGAREVVFDCKDVTISVLDDELAVAVGTTNRSDGGKNVVTRTRGDSAWRLVTDLPVEEAVLAEGPGPVAGITADGKGVLVITAGGTGAGRLVDLALETGEVREVLAEDDRYDIAGVVRHPSTGVPLWAIVERDLPGHVGIDTEATAELERLAGIIGAEPVLRSQSDDNAVWTVLVRREDRPVEAWLHHVGGDPEKLPASRPDLDAYPLAPRTAFRFTARDGLELEGYLTLPVVPAQQPPAAVLWVHGGPWHRDLGGFHPIATLLSDRGYAAVQVNYRSSTGYGVEVLEAGNKEWGRAMSTDLLDALDHLAAEGLIDRSRVAITGGSYGGYATLAAAAFTPDEFVCAVDMVGPSDLVTLMAGVPPYWEAMRALFARRMGDVETEKEMLLERSPLTKAADIRIPLLIVQGANDPRVRQSESDQIVAALTANGIEHEYLLMEDEGHGFAKPENMQLVMRRMESFLAQHLGGRCE